MAKGLNKVLPLELRREMCLDPLGHKEILLRHALLKPQEIAQLLSGLEKRLKSEPFFPGLGTLNVDDWEMHTAYTHGLHKDLSGHFLW